MTVIQASDWQISSATPKFFHQKIIDHAYAATCRQLAVGHKPYRKYKRFKVWQDVAQGWVCIADIRIQAETQGAGVNANKTDVIAVGAVFLKWKRQPLSIRPYEIFSESSSSSFRR
jgi:hypothetical protein